VPKRPSVTGYVVPKRPSVTGYVVPKRPLVTTNKHGVTSQKSENLICTVTAARNDGQILSVFAQVV
jgi:hypothetical protein